MQDSISSREFKFDFILILPYENIVRKDRRIGCQVRASIFGILRLYSHVQLPYFASASLISSISHVTLATFFLAVLTMNP